MIRRVLLVCVLSAFCLSTLLGCAPTPGDDAPPATTAAE